MCVPQPYHLFTNGRKYIQAGYREGITAGKESALQAGFDAAFKDVGAPLGRELGRLRGIASAISSFLASTAPSHDAAVLEARDITSQLAMVRFSDISPRDLEAEEHSRQHLQSDINDGCVEDNEDVIEKRQMEGLGNMLAKLTTSDVGETGRPTMDDVMRLKDRLSVLCREAGLGVDWG
jgi:hypothetical protein